ncbi:hypothetical protein [Sphingobium sp. BS19]|uniref:hypothetical protein n=1 Tax=Sphingobium sp. BS19 TaxID=3018973 RepID=UPI0022EE189C|nr:hypothetical protein [Sphingobium sp. BS19]GLI98194.1 hypothetical protein Sbs19_20120 [Sphingobium sp. BS19]
MQIIVSRTRLSGTPPDYEYRALALAEGLTAERLARAPTVPGPKSTAQIPCVRIAQLIAPERYFTIERDHDRAELATRILIVARRIETLIVRSIFPEMTADWLPITFRVEHDPADAATWTSIDDLDGAFDRFKPDRDILTAFDLGLRQDSDRRAA